jgi:hypothetical protein
LGIERLDDVIIHTGSAASGLVIGAPLAGHHDHGGFGQRPVAADGPCDLIAIDAIHGGVSKNDIGLDFCRLADGRFAVFYSDDVRVFAGKCHLHDTTHGRAVVRNQYGHRHGGPPRSEV